MKKRLTWIGVVAVLAIVIGVVVKVMMPSSAGSADVGVIYVNGVEAKEEVKIKGNPERAVLELSHESIINGVEVTEVAVKEDPKADFGSAKNPLMVLEIVPHESMANFGYYIDGCEPINMDELCADGCYDYPFQDVINVKSVEYVFPDELPNDALVNQDMWNFDTELSILTDGVMNSYTKNTSNLQEQFTKGYTGDAYWADSNKTLYGYFQKVDSGSGKWNFDFDTKQFEPVGMEGGDYNWITVSDDISDVTLTDTSKIKQGNGAPTQIWMQREGLVYKRNHVSYTHNNHLVNRLFGENNPNSKVEVIVATPEVFLNDKNLALIDLADLIYVHQFDTSAKVIELWDKYNKENKSLEEESLNQWTMQYQEDFRKHDLPWRAVMSIIKCRERETPPALIIGGTNDIKSFDGDNNVYKLLLMTIEHKPKVFAENFKYQDPLNFKEEYPDPDQDSKYDIVTISKVDSKGHNLMTGKIQSRYSGGGDGVVWNPHTLFLVDKQDPAYQKDAGMKNYQIVDPGSTVEDNVYTSSGSGFVNDYVQPTITENKDGLKELFDYYQDPENYPDIDPDTADNRPTQLSTNDVVIFLLKSLRQTSIVKYKDSGLKVLEVQPCNKFIYNTDDDSWQSEYVRFFPNMSKTYMKNKLTVVTMPTWEFITNIDDLNSEYDAIIFGTNQDISNGAEGYFDNEMNTQPETVTFAAAREIITNAAEVGGNNPDNTNSYTIETTDTVHKGLIYTSVGDIVSGKNTMEVDGKFQINQDMRYSGNDITEKKLKELLSYMEAGKPIILDSGFVDVSGTAVRDDMIDKSSYIHQLAEVYTNPEVCAGFAEKYGTASFGNVTTSAVFVKGHYDTEKKQQLGNMLGKEVCRLNLTKQPVSYKCEYSGEKKENVTFPDEYYTDRKDFSYQFQIVSDGTSDETDYTVDLLIDDNGDGIYEGSQNNMEANGIDPASSEGFRHELVDRNECITITDKNNKTVTGNLKPNTTYTLKVDLSENYMGVMPWKLEVYQTGNHQCRSSVIDYSAIKPVGGKKTKIRVLQMNPRNNMNYDVGTAIDMSSNKDFIKYKDLPDYEIQIDFLKNSEWSEKYSTLEAWENLLDFGKNGEGGYDMVILGFMDQAEYTSNKVFDEGLKYFESQGKAVIYSHDMVCNWVMNDDNDYSNNLRTLRETVGQMRFDTCETMLNGNKVDLRFWNWWRLFDANGNAINAWGTGYDYQRDGKWKTAAPDNSALLFCLFHRTNMADRYVHADAVMNWPTSLNDTTESTTTRINMINEGQITTYPYNISSTIEVARTHAQYYQLDVDQPNMVVWYGLTDARSSQVDENNLNDGVYSSRESDGRNNYYIYNNGNITYTGLGHSGEMTIDEVRLFINTMIAAYRSTAAAPKIEVVDDDPTSGTVINTDADGSNVTIYVPIDEKNALINDTTNAAASLTVKFKVTDPSLIPVADRKYALQYYDANGDSPRLIPISTFDEKAGKPLTPPGAVALNVNAEKNITGLQLEQAVQVYKDNVYSFDVNYSDLLNGGSVQYYMVLKSHYVDRRNIEIFTTKETKVTIMQMPLFMLN